MATHSSVPAWRIPGTEEPGGLLSMGSHRIGHNWSDLARMHLGGLSLKVSLACGNELDIVHVPWDLKNQSCPKWDIKQPSQKPEAYLPSPPPSQGPPWPPSPTSPTKHCIMPSACLTTWSVHIPLPHIPTPILDRFSPLQASLIPSQLPLCSILSPDSIRKPSACMSAQPLQSSPTLCNSTDCSPPGSSAHAIL